MVLMKTFPSIICVTAFLLLVGKNLSNADDKNPYSEFEKTVKPYITKHCVRCHGEEAQEGDFRVDTLSPNVATGPTTNQWREVIEKINSGEMPPEDEPNRPDAEVSAIITEWLANKIEEGREARLAKRERVSFHRLTRVEYANSIHDLLGVRFEPADPGGLSEDAEYRGFERIGSVMSVSSSHIEKYIAAAESNLDEAYPESPVPRTVVRKKALDLRGGPSKEQIAQLEKAGLADKVRVDMWPGHRIQGGRPGPGNQMFKNGGLFKVRIQVSGLKPKGGRAPHLTFYADKVDRMLFEQDIQASEAEPTIVEFHAHLPAGGHTFQLMNDVPGPSILPRSGRSGRKPFFSINDGRIPWQLKLTDEEGRPLYPFLIVDWVEWEGPIVTELTKKKLASYMPADGNNLAATEAALTLFVERAFRRPATAAEINKYLGLVDSEIEAGAKFQSAMKAAMLAVLCSKNFLYLVEGSPGKQRQQLNNWEIASRLSYFLWSTMPDEELFSLARDGQLTDKSVLTAQVRRMLRDPKGEAFATEFPRQWLQLQKVGMFPPDSKLYPEYDSYLEKSMILETSKYFAEVLKRNASLGEFIDSNWTMVNPRLAMHYGIEGIEEDRFRRVAFNDEKHRGGILTHASILSLTSDGTRHRPVHRGVWVMESIFGKSPPPPPANVEPIEPNPVDSPKATIRVKLEAHKENPNCAACHRKIDPLGFAFDNYDAVGRWRTEERVSKGTGANPPVDASGELADGRKFSGPDDFKRLLLADIDEFNKTFIKKLSVFAFRRTMTGDDEKDIQQIARASKDANYRLQDIVEAFVTSDFFQKR